MAYDPNLMIAPDAGGQFARAFEHGQQTGRQNKARAAMSALVRDPSNQAAFEAFASADPEGAMSFRKQQLEYSKSQLGAHYDNAVKGGQIVRQTQPKDQASWDQTLAAAQQAGIDVSQVPRLWDDNTAKYAQQLSGLADTFEPLSNPQLVPFTEGGGVARMNPQTHQLETLVMPNQGGHTPGSPVAAEPPPAAIAHLRASPDLAPQFDEIFGPGAAQKVMGGQTGAPSGGFPY